MKLNLVVAVATLIIATDTFAQAPVPPTATDTNPPPSLAELPHWPYAMLLPDDAFDPKSPPKKTRKADVLAWAPAGAKHIRAVLLIPNNSDSKIFGEHQRLREVAAKREMGIVYLRAWGYWYESNPPTDTNRIFAVLSDVAKLTGIAEFHHAPWIAIGKSSRGRFPFGMAWTFPRQTIACMSYHGETPPWPPPEWARVKDETILYLNVNGEVEWDSTWYRHVRPCHLNYRSMSSWLPHQVVVHGVGHGNYADAHGSPGWGKPVPPDTTSVLRVWDYMALFVDKALQLRLPGNEYPTAGPIKLAEVDESSGYLIHPRAAEELLGARWRPLRETNGVFQIVDHIKEPGQVYDDNPGKVDPALLIRKAKDVPAGERKGLFWIADRELAEAWLKLHNVKGLDVKIPE